MVFTPSSIGYYLHYSLIFHFIERKSIIHCINIDGCFQASMKQGGWGWGGVNNCTYFSGCHTIRLWGQKKKKVLNTHAYRLHIDCIVSCTYELLIGALSHRADIAVQTNPKDHVHIQLTWVFDIQQQNIAKCFFFFFCFKVPFKCSASS